MLTSVLAEEKRECMVRWYRWKLKVWKQLRKTALSFDRQARRHTEELGQLSNGKELKVFLAVVF